MSDRSLTGPAKGPRLNRAIAIALFSGTVTSAMVPPPKAMGVPPTKPERMRKAMNWSTFLLNAVAAINATKMVLVAWYTGMRPYASLSGEMTMGPMARPRE